MGTSGRVGRGRPSGVQKCAIVLSDRRDDANVVLGTSKLDNYFHVPIGEVVFRENGEAGVGTVGNSGGIGVGHEGDGYAKHTVNLPLDYGSREMWAHHLVGEGTMRNLRLYMHNWKPHTLDKQTDYKETIRSMSNRKLWPPKVWPPRVAVWQ